MAMTHKEKALMERLLTQAALRSTSPVEADVPPPERWGEALTKGFLPVAAGSNDGRVVVACSSSSSRGIGRDDAVTSQKAVYLYSTRLRALKALRWEAEQVFAQRLRKIDQMIELEEAQEGDHE
jgi:hypothetical protein